MSKVTNLRQFRKQADREKKRLQGSENATKHGVTKAERAKIEAERDRARETLDQHRIERGEEP